MINNDPKFEVYEIPNSESISKVESKIQTRLDSISRIIINKERYQKKDSDYIDFPFIKPVNYLLERLVLLGIFWAEVTHTNNYFYTDSKCVGCDICEKVCLSQKIKLKNKKPVWQKNVKCYA